jgi:transcriptional regulator with XRE-family HTH domain
MDAGGNAIADFFSTLRREGEERGFSLDDISSATRIRRQVLESLERGETERRPETYLRAFVRSYARVLELDETELLRRYDGARRADTIAKSEEESLPSSPSTGRTFGRIPQSSIPWIFGTLLLLSLMVSLSFLRETEQRADIQEIPFSEVVKLHDSATGESESRVMAAVKERSSNQAMQSKPGEPTGPRTQPPLTLRAMTFDTVWIRILIDGEMKKEYRAPPRWSGQWKANDHFLISVGNPHAVTLTLDNILVKLPFQPGKPVRNYRVERSPDADQPQ